MERLSYWYDGQAIEKNTIELSIQDPGLLYGATVFTTLRVYESLDHSLTNWSGHCDRLQKTIDFFDWQQPNWQQIRRGAEWLMHRYPVLRIVIFSDGREWITGRQLPTDLIERQQKGITAWIARAEFKRSLAHHKTGNYLAPWLASQTARRLNAQEAILIDDLGNWLETSGGTLWGWRDGIWSTPPLANEILPGLVRSRLITELKCQNEEVIEETWNRETIEQFSAIAYTNCVVEVVPIHTVIDGTAKWFYDPAHPSFARLRQRFVQGSAD